MTDLEGAMKALRSLPVAEQTKVIEGLFVALCDKIDAQETALASITRERDAMREAGKPFFDLAKTVTTPTPGSPPWWQESQDWTVVFSFAGCVVTLGDLRRAAALVNGEGA